MKWHNARKRIFFSAKKFNRDTNGATAIEYGLLIALIAMGILTALTALSGSLGTLFGEVENTTTENSSDTSGSGNNNG